MYNSIKIHHSDDDGGGDDGNNKFSVLMNKFCSFFSLDSLCRFEKHNKKKPKKKQTNSLWKQIEDNKKNVGPRYKIC